MKVKIIYYSLKSIFPIFAIGLSIEKKILTAIQPYKHGELLRLGNEFDGGYVLSKRLLFKSNLLLSIGINNEWSFEFDFARKTNKPILMIDDKFSFMTNLFSTLRSVTCLSYRFWDKRIYNVLRDWFSFWKYYLRMALFSAFRLKYRRFRVSRIDDLSSNNISLGSLLKKYNLFSNTKGILLKMDIEGAEYETISSIIKYEKLFSGLIIEFHGVTINNDVFLKSIDSLVNFFNIIHVHYNNYSFVQNGICDVIELTFVRKDEMFKQSFSENNYPIFNLDFPNDKSKPDLNINFYDL